MKDVIYDKSVRSQLCDKASRSDRAEIYAGT